MDLNTNYYAILGATHQSTIKEIKKLYYKLSFEFHPDHNKDVDPEKFQIISKAYNVLTENKEHYDRKSKFGKDYNELEELFKVDMGYTYDHNRENEKYEKFKDREVLDIIIDIEEDSFNGSIEYPRYVSCKSCGGSGKDIKSKIIIKDEFGNIKGQFDADDGCDFCDGTGKDYANNKCGFCAGQGKIGMKDCDNCKGERRILGKQKLSGIKLTGDETKIESMGNISYYIMGNCGNLILRKKI